MNNSSPASRLIKFTGFGLLLISILACGLMPDPVWEVAGGVASDYVLSTGINLRALTET